MIALLQRVSRAEVTVEGKSVGAIGRGLLVLVGVRPTDDEVSARRHSDPASVALAWLLTRPVVTAPIASATTLTQLTSLLKGAQLALHADDVAQLDKASAWR